MISTSKMKVMNLFFYSFILINPIFITSMFYEIEVMTKCVTQHDAFIYNGYGCYCGPGGSGEVVDGIDKCCAEHDKCYGDLNDKKACWRAPFEYLPFYTFECTDGNVTCTEIEQFGRRILPGDCGAGLCECDKKLVECWSQFPEPKTHAKCDRLKKKP